MAMSLPTESAEDEFDEIWIRRARAALRDFRGALTSAENSLRGASRALSELTGPLFDVELAETFAGEDADQELRTAGRALRNLQRIAELRWALLESGSGSEPR